MGEMQRQGVIPDFEPASDPQQNDATTGTPPTNLKPGFEIPSWSEPGMPGMGWPNGVRNSQQDCDELTAKFQQGKQ